MSLLNEILKLKNNKIQFFTTPSHHQGVYNLKYLKDWYKLDFSEMDGLDNLRHPECVIKNMLDDLTKIYNTKQTFALINGSSSGNIVAMLTILNQNDKVLIIDNCHVSVKNGIALTKARPIFITPNYDKNFNCPVSLDKNLIIDKLKQDNFKAIIITSPTYEGVSFDIKEIIDFAHSQNTFVIVDEAHGALFPFSDKLPQSAIALGADFVVQSLHKTAGGVNPTALLHIGKNSVIEPNDVQKSLNLINTTSPSYPILICIEEVVNYLAKNRIEIDKLVENIEQFKKSFENKIDFLPSYQICLKINDADMVEFADKLYKKYRIECEIAESDYALFYCGIGTTKKQLDYLKKSINKILYSFT